LAADDSNHGHQRDIMMSGNQGRIHSTVVVLLNSFTARNATQYLHQSSDQIYYPNGMELKKRGLKRKILSNLPKFKEKMRRNDN
jgi:hypothetical protein